MQLCIFEDIKFNWVVEDMIFVYWDCKGAFEFKRV